MTIAAFTGSHPGIGQGMLEEGKTLCPVQLLLERELSLGVRFYSRPVEVSPEALNLDSILDVGFGLTKSHLTAEKTLHHFREHLWCPEMMDRSGWNGPETDHAVLQKMQQRVHELTEDYEEPSVDPDKLAEMRKVVERARRDLVD